MVMGRNSYGPKWSWAEMVMGRNDPESQSPQCAFFSSVLFLSLLLVPASPGVSFHFVKSAIDQLVNWSESFPTDDLIPKNRRCRNQHSLVFQIPTASKDAYNKKSFFPQTIRDWNVFPDSLISSAVL